jgi:hypothetical protein
LGHIVALDGAADGCAVELADGMLPGFGDSIAAEGAAAGAGVGALDVDCGVGTDTIGSGPPEVGADAGLAASDGTGAAAISAVPAP